MIIDILDNHNVVIGSLYGITDIMMNKGSDLVVFKSEDNIVFKLDNGFYKIR